MTRQLKFKIGGGVGGSTHIHRYWVWCCERAWSWFNVVKDMAHLYTSLHSAK